MKKIIIALGTTVLVAGGAGAGLYAYYNQESDLVYKDVYVEAGTSDCDVKEFLKKENASATFTADSTFDASVPGDYDLKIKAELPIFGEKEFSTTLHVQDTVAPKLTLAEESIEMYTTAVPPEITDLVANVEDVTNCTIDFEKSYDFTKEGQFDITILAKDTSGNETKGSIPCKVIADVTPPEIKGVENLVIAQGDAVSYKKNIEVVDDQDENPTLEVDSTGVNVDKRGVYTVIYRATDAAGNTSEKTASVKIISAKIAAATEETVYAKADEILADIITPGMTQLQQARAVFDWVVKNITYSETAGIDDVLSAAYKGMFNRIGDCTVKQKTAEVMLNRLGIKNMEIEKIRDTRGHYWLLIDVGEGWYHYDPNLQLDGTLIFYWHDADLWEYSNAHKNTHNYDPAKYPHIQ
ncbi:Transglutaminase-like superfamily protein [Pseudobutyrivibrio sp. ACV-2]|uniref:transglutaminase domain-containing protein n=1 Tax=Pseudobutyrivibrio sp. ACV-2 TaxID=1520801 RepID=UPI000895E7C1|nr:transglutaminase domain-containing protein [Pseudobutyrivibrio sp. ACV-2]SEA29040.1 Transglutaminase-like superfamily protein [Pseudobutyrivibrio sp. ACV-2]